MSEMTFANVVRYDPVLTEDETGESACEILLENEEIQLSPKEQYLIENDLILYDFNNDMKSEWEHLGFLTDLKHEQVVNIIEKCMIVTELEEDTELDDLDDDYSESDIYD